jgi:hypothetical protein
MGNQFTMGKETREQLFRKAFDIFMNTYADRNHLNLVKWDVQRNRLKNTNIHQYQVTIPRSYYQYSLNSYTDPDGNIHEAEEIYTYQYVPQKDAFITQFASYFDDYFIVKDEIVVSYVKLDAISTQSEDLIARIKVQFISKQFPFPMPPTELEEANQFICELQERIAGLKNNIDIGFSTYTEHINMLNIQFKREFNILTNHIKAGNRMSLRMIEKLKEFYTLENAEDCPVCYEKITPDMLVVPLCSHFICSSCCKNCSSCPICRTAYKLNI